MKTVLTNGCFDILHRGHFEMLKFAAEMGDHLIVGIDSDKKVKRDKGDNRPFNSEDDRKFALKSTRYVDEVIIFHSADDLENLYKIVSPDIMIIGSDWKGKKIVGEQYAKEVLFFDRIPNYSTTRILEGKNSK